jgi:Dickkopf N-terminal cysteine-rich region
MFHSHKPIMRSISRYGSRGFGALPLMAALCIACSGGGHTSDTQAPDAGSEHPSASGGMQPSASGTGGAGARSAAANGGRDARSAAGAVSAGKDAPAHVVAGVDSDSGTGPDTSGLPVPVETIAAALAKAVCGALDECLGAQKLSALFGREPCETRFSKSLAQDDLASLDASVRSGRVRIDADALAKCYQDTRALVCRVQAERLPASCQTAIAGQVVIGAVCSIGSDCAGEAFCPQSACPRACTARAAKTEACTRDEECQTGLICNVDHCEQPAAVGAMCAGDTSTVCAFGNSCVGSTNTQAGVCKPNAEVQIGALDAVCTPGGTLCQEGLSCAFDGKSGFNCQAAAGTDDSCHLALPTECPNEDYCDAADVMTAGTCVTLPSDGAACVLGDQCAPGHVCVPDSAKKPVCRRVGDLGESCTVAAMCRSGYCADGSCAKRALCE